MESLFYNKIAIVTGGGSGIGKALSEELARRGAIVNIADIDNVGTEKLVLSLASQGYKVYPYHLDVTDQGSFLTMIDDIVSRYGRLDYIFNNAGIAIFGEIRDIDLAQWEKIMKVNVWGVIYGTTVAYKFMVKQGFGHIVNIASGAGLFPNPTQALYSTTKYAIVGLTTSLRPEAKNLGVKVSVVCPGPVRTNIIQTLEAVKIIPEYQEAAVQSIRFVEPEDAARIILRGVERNKGIIIVNSIVNVLWWLYRISPGLFEKIIGSSMVKEFRQYRDISR